MSARIQQGFHVDDPAQEVVIGRDINLCTCFRRPSLPCVCSSRPPYVDLYRRGRELSYWPCDALPKPFKVLCFDFQDITGYLFPTYSRMFFEPVGPLQVTQLRWLAVKDGAI